MIFNALQHRLVSWIIANPHKTNVSCSQEYYRVLNTLARTDIEFAHPEYRLVTDEELAKIRKILSYLVIKFYTHPDNFWQFSTIAHFAHRLPASYYERIIID